MYILLILMSVWLTDITRAYFWCLLLPEDYHGYMYYRCWTHWPLMIWHWGDLSEVTFKMRPADQHHTPRVFHPVALERSVISRSSWTASPWHNPPEQNPTLHVFLKSDLLRQYRIFVVIGMSTKGQILHKSIPPPACPNMSFCIWVPIAPSVLTYDSNNRGLPWPVFLETFYSWTISLVCPASTSIVTMVDCNSRAVNSSRIPSRFTPIAQKAPLTYLGCIPIPRFEF